MTTLDFAPPAIRNAAPRRVINVASISTLFPTDEHPHRGVFVERRLHGLSEFANVRVIQPVPWFPWLRPRQPHTANIGRATSPRVCVVREPMFYLPKVLKSCDSRWLERSILPKLRRWKHNNQLDLIDAHFGYPEGVASVSAATRLGLPVFVTLRGNEIKYLAQRSIAPQLLAALHRATGLITVSHSLKQAIVARGVPTNKVTVIPNAVDTQIFRPASKAIARAALELPTNRRFLVSVGHLVYEKGHHLAIEALHELRRDQPDLELIVLGGVAGEPEWPQRLRDLAARLGLTDAVRFVGSQDPLRVATWLQAADLFVLATYREGCCNAVLEALACGLPVVTTDVGDNERYVAPPQHGLIVPSGNSQMLAQAVATALNRTWDSPAISQSISQLGGWPEVARQVARLFEASVRCGSIQNRSIDPLSAGSDDL